MRPLDYQAAGAVANKDQLACATLATVHGGPAHGCRVLDLRVWRGIDLRVLPERGFDIGAAWYRGVPLAWISGVGETGPIENLQDTSWVDAFGGGLMMTCGLRNVGAPSEGHGQHGRYSHLRAQNVAVRRADEQDGEFKLTATATITEVSALGPHLQVERTISTRTGSGLVEITDVTTNLGDAAEPTPILYHINIGPPLLYSGCKIVINSAEVIPRDAEAKRWLGTWAAPGPPQPGARERVYEHIIRPEANGWAEAIVARNGIELRLRWEQAELPRFHQWIHPARGVYALGLEPANCSVLGRAYDRSEGRLPMLEPAASRRTRLQLQARLTDHD